MEMALTHIVFLISVVACVAEIPDSCDPGWMKAGTSCYWVTGNGTQMYNHGMATEVCRSLNSHPVSVQTVEEFHLIGGILDQWLVKKVSKDDEYDGGEYDDDKKGRDDYVSFDDGRDGSSWSLKDEVVAFWTSGIRVMSAEKDAVSFYSWVDDTNYGTGWHFNTDLYIPEKLGGVSRLDNMYAPLDKYPNSPQNFGEEVVIVRDPGQDGSQKYFLEEMMPGTPNQYILCERDTFIGCKKSSLGTDYNGALNYNEEGLTCQRWDKTYPNVHGWLDKNFPLDGSMSAAGNKCRNPDKSASGPWCYMNDTMIATALQRLPCVVTWCPDAPENGRECYNDDDGQHGAGYNGQLSTTKSGYRCQRWDGQWPHKHNFTRIHFPDADIEAAENFCRNPSVSPGGPWCFTTDPNMVMENCAVQTPCP